MIHDELEKKCTYSIEPNDLLAYVLKRLSMDSATFDAAFPLLEAKLHWEM